MYIYTFFIVKKNFLKNIAFAGTTKCDTKLSVTNRTPWNFGSIYDFQSDYMTHT